VEAAVLLDADAVTITTTSAAFPSGEVRTGLIVETPDTCFTACATWSSAAVSALVSGPDAREVTMIAVRDGFVV
jgi:hypothetical protein